MTDRDFDSEKADFEKKARKRAADGKEKTTQAKFKLDKAKKRKADKQFGKVFGEGESLMKKVFEHTLAFARAVWVEARRKNESDPWPEAVGRLKTQGLHENVMGLMSWPARLIVEGCVEAKGLKVKPQPRLASRVLAGLMLRDLHNVRELGESSKLVEDGRLVSFKALTEDADFKAGMPSADNADDFFAWCEKVFERMHPTVAGYLLREVKQCRSEKPAGRKSISRKS